MLGKGSTPRSTRQTEAKWGRGGQTEVEDDLQRLPPSACAALPRSAVDSSVRTVGEQGEATKAARALEAEEGRK